MATCQVIRRLRWTASACRGLSTGVTPLEGCSVPISDDCFESLPSSLLSKVRERLGVRTPTEIQRKVLLLCTHRFIITRTHAETFTDTNLAVICNSFHTSGEMSTEVPLNTIM